MARAALIVACILATPFLFLGVILFLGAALIAIHLGVAWVLAGTAFLRYQIWRLTR